MNGGGPALGTLVLDVLMSQCRSLVVLAPHPDDEVFGCAGLIQSALASGKRVHVAVATDGEACHAGLTASQQQAMSALRRRETCTAAMCMGLPQTALSFWSLGDGSLHRQGHALNARIDALIDADTCFVAPWSGDGHPDHAALGLAAEQALSKSDGALLRYAVWSRLVHSPERTALDECAPLRMALTNSSLRAKRMAALCFRSQIRATSGKPPVITADALTAFVEEPEVFVIDAAARHTAIRRATQSHACLG